MSRKLSAFLAMAAFLAADAAYSCPPAQFKLFYRDRDGLYELNKDLFLNKPEVLVSKLVPMFWESAPLLPPAPARPLYISAPEPMLSQDNFVNRLAPMGYLGMGVEMGSATAAVMAGYYLAYNEEIAAFHIPILRPSIGSNGKFYLGFTLQLKF